MADESRRLFWTLFITWYDVIISVLLTSKKIFLTRYLPYGGGGRRNCAPHRSFYIKKARSESGKNFPHCHSGECKTDEQ